jgi:3-hydroxymyristoyl/3-hydroxydecanoyl-(acyl carrier protein) dehydratase
MIDVVLELDHGLCTTVRLATAGEVVRDDPASDAGYPFSLLLEAMAQAAIPLAGEEGAGHHGEGAGAPPPGGAASPRGGALAGIDAARLLRPVHYGDRLLITASIVGQFGNMIRVRTRAERADEPPGEAIVAEGEFTIALEDPS